MSDIKIRGSQIKPGTLPFSVVDTAFATTLLGQKAVTDFIQLNNISVTPGDASVAITPTNLGAANFAGIPITTVGQVSGAPGAGDLGFVASPAGGGLLAKSRSVVRNAVDQEPIFDSSNREIYGYFIVDTINSVVAVKLYSFDGTTENPVNVPSSVTMVDLQLMHRFTLDTVGEDFGANEKWALGMVDATTSLNITQLSKDIYGLGGHLDNDGQANLGTSLIDQIANANSNADLVSGTIVNHINNPIDAHDATAISFVSGTTGISATNVQTAIENLKSYADTLASASTSGSTVALQHHIDAAWSDIDAHHADQIAVAAYVASGTHSLTSGSLQDNLEAMVDRTFGAYSLIQTHLAEPNAHAANAIDVLTSGSAFDAHFPSLVANVTTDLQTFLAAMHTEMHNVVVATSGTLQGEIDAANTAVTTLSTTVDSISGTLQSEINANASNNTALNTKIDSISGTLQGEVTANANNISANFTTLDNKINFVSGTLQGEIAANATAISNNTALINAVSGTLQGEIDNLSTTSAAALAAVSGTLQGEITANATLINGVSGTLQGEITANTNAITANTTLINTVSGTLQSEITAANTAISNNAALINSVSGTLQSEITANTTAISSNATLINSVSGTLQSEINTANAAITTNSATISAVSGTLQTQITANGALVNAVSGTLQGEITANAVLITAVSGTLQNEIGNVVTALGTTDNRIDSLVGVAGGASTIDLTSTHYMTANTDLVSALKAFDTSVFSAIGGAGTSLTSEIARLETAVGISTGGTGVNFSGTFLTSGTVKTAVQKLDTELTHVFTVLGANTAEPHTHSFTTQTNTGTQLVVADADSYATAIDKNRANLARHIAQTADVHAASAITFVSGTTAISANNVQRAFELVANRLNRLETEVVEQEDVPVVSSGAGQTFTLNFAAKPGTKALVIWNSTIQNDYTLSGNQFTINFNMTGGVGGDTLQIWYKRVVTDIA